MDERTMNENAYRKVFMTPLGGVVLAELAEYCHFLESIKGEYEQGQRDVFLHILDMYGIESMTDVVEAIQKIKRIERKEDDGFTEPF